MLLSDSIETLTIIFSIWKLKETLIAHFPKYKIYCTPEYQDNLKFQHILSKLFI
jgi:hypothetical protein